MELFNLENTKILFWFLESCQGVKQNPEWHPEGDVFIHSLQVGSLAFRESNDIDLILAAYLHDVGKIILSCEHARIGGILLYPYLTPKTLFLIENHMRFWTYINGEMKKLSKCIEMAKHPWLPELVQLSRWDRLGRNPNKKVTYNKQKIIDKLNDRIDKHFEIPTYLKEYEGCYGLKGNSIETKKVL